jgi:hypothetical protein
MHFSEKQLVIEEANARRMAISAEKGPEYSGAGSSYTVDADVLYNFKSVGARLGLEPLEVAGVYMTKHYDSVMTFLKGTRGEDIQELAYRGEGIVSRLDDLRNYLDLIECLLIDVGALPPPLVKRANDL